MGKLIIIVDVPDQDPTKVDPHEAAADILYHYEAHRETNQDEPMVTFVDAKWFEVLAADAVATGVITVSEADAEPQGDG